MKTQEPLDFLSLHAFSIKKKKIIKKCNAFSKPSYSLQEWVSTGLTANRQKGVVFTINRQTSSYY